MRKTAMILALLLTAALFCACGEHREEGSREPSAAPTKEVTATESPTPAPVSTSVENELPRIDL